MVFPIIPVLSIILIVFGGSSLAFYNKLNDDEKNEADELAMEMFSKTVKQLSRAQSRKLEQRFFG